MPKLKLGKWMIRADRHNWILYQMRMPDKPSHRRKDDDETPEPYEDIYGYYTSLPTALAHLLDLNLRSSDAEGVEALRDELDKNIREIRSIYEVLLR